MIFKKIAVLGLCISLSINSVAYAGILDLIIDEPVTVEDLNSNEETTPLHTETKSTNTKIEFSDIDDHWAKNWINEAVKIGFVSGYDDGTFLPDNNITRAEFSKMINNALKTENKAEIGFPDVDKSKWFYDEVSKSVASGFFSGYDDNTFRPNNPIKRQEVAKVIHNAMTTGGIDGEGATLLSDYNSIQEWAKPSVNAVYNKGYILGYSNKTYRPAKDLTRAEAAKIICELIDNENIEYGFNITNYNELYTSAVVVGNINILESVGTGNVYLKNLVVLGDIVIHASKVNTVQLTDVRARNIIVKSENNPVKIVCNDNVTIANIIAPPTVTVQKNSNNVNI